ncbi:unnamed protein product, partial [Prorocentrum cordatum]
FWCSSPCCWSTLCRSASSRAPLTTSSEHSRMRSRRPWKRSWARPRHPSSRRYRTTPLAWSELWLRGRMQLISKFRFSSLIFKQEVMCWNTRSTRCGSKWRRCGKNFTAKRRPSRSRTMRTCRCGIASQTRRCLLRACRRSPARRRSLRSSLSGSLRQVLGRINTSSLVTVPARSMSYRCSAIVMLHSAKFVRLDGRSSGTLRTGGNLELMQCLVDGQKYSWDWTNRPDRSERKYKQNAWRPLSNISYLTRESSMTEPRESCSSTAYRRLRSRRVTRSSPRAAYYGTALQSRRREWTRRRCRIRSMLHSMRSRTQCN